MRILVTGATGYVGSRLVPRLLQRGHRVRALARDPQNLARFPWAGDVDVARGDLLDVASLEPALRGVDAAVYLVHGMGAGPGFRARDRAAALNFTTAAHAAGGLGLVVYLGGLQPEGGATSPRLATSQGSARRARGPSPKPVSEHLASRAEVGHILRTRLPTTELRAGPIVGAGSGSFEMVRHLTERLPVMVAPRWVLNPVQPIAAGDALRYLELALEREPLGVVEVGGADVVSFRDMMLEYAEARGLRRVVVPVPVLTPRLASLWVGLVTPLSNRLATPLILGIQRPVVADTARARREFPEVRPAAYREAVERALAGEEGGVAAGADNGDGVGAVERGEAL